MRSRAKLLGHPIHQMLIVFPLGLLAMAVVFDLLAIGLAQPYWSEIAFWMIGAGIVTGLIAAPFGFVDWAAIPSGTRAKRIGALHGLGNILVLLLFAASWYARRAVPPSPNALALSMSFIGGGLALLTGWLGGELVDRLAIGVDDNANADAPSSFRTHHVRIRP